MCKCPLKLKYGNIEKVSYVSSENLFKLSQRKDCDRSKTLAQMVEVMGMEVSSSPKLSDRVCKPCGRKIRNVSELFTFIRREINALPVANEELSRFKRQLPTTVLSPERSPLMKKVQRISEDELSRHRTLAKPTLRKALFAKENLQKPAVVSEKKENKDGDNVAADNILSALNIDELVEKKTMKVKTVMVYPNGRVDTYELFDNITKTLLINLALKKWNVVANVIFKHPTLKKQLYEPLKRTVNTEFKEYCSNSGASESMLKQVHPTDLESFSNKLFLEEVRVFCSFWMSCLLGACNVSFDSKTVKQVNAMALSTSVAARCANQLMFAVSYRISAILFNSGVKYQDIVCISLVCVCCQTWL